MQQEIARRTGRRTSLGAVYATLSRLEEKGLVGSRLGDPTPQRGGRAKKHYELRAALGATQGEIVALVVRQGARMAAIGIVLGLVAAAALSRALASLLFGISPLDPITYIVTAAMLLAVSLLACLVPARRAATVDPIETLPAE